jgi:hypothetical protein
LAHQRLKCCNRLWSAELKAPLKATVDGLKSFPFSSCRFLRPYLAALFTLGVSGEMPGWCGTLRFRSFLPKGRSKSSSSIHRKQLKFGNLQLDATHCPDFSGSVRELSVFASGVLTPSFRHSKFAQSFQGGLVVFFESRFSDGPLSIGTSAVSIISIYFESVGSGPLRPGVLIALRDSGFVWGTFPSSVSNFGFSTFILRPCYAPRCFPRW